MIRVHDMGPDFPADAVPDGLGLATTRARLDQLYGEGHAFTCGNDADGAWVRMDLPYRRDAGRPAQEAGAWNA